MLARGQRVAAFALYPIGERGSEREPQQPVQCRDVSQIQIGRKIFTQGHTVAVAMKGTEPVQIQSLCSSDPEQVAKYMHPLACTISTSCLFSERV